MTNTADGARRIPPPSTRLRQRYNRIGAREFSTKDRLDECLALLEDPLALAREYLDAVEALAQYDNSGEGFLPSAARGGPQKSAGALKVVAALEAGKTVRVAGCPDYAFAYMQREVGPLRTTGIRQAKSGHGGIDYVARIESPSRGGVLGEIKHDGDKDAYYAFVQLLTYLSEMNSPAQRRRASRFLFDDDPEAPGTAPWDLHILLADYNDRGPAKNQLITATRTLAAAVKREVGRLGPDTARLGRTLCLRMHLATFDGTLDLEWCE